MALNVRINIEGFRPGLRVGSGVFLTREIQTCRNAVRWQSLRLACLGRLESQRPAQQWKLGVRVTSFLSGRRLWARPIYR
jgi:hypothetical protein